MLFGAKYKLVLLTKTADGYVYVKQKKVRVGKTELNIDGRPFYVDVSASSYVKGRTHYIYMDYVTGETLNYREHGGLTPDEAEGKAADRLTKIAMMAAGGENFGLIMLIVVAVAGLAIGFLLGQNITIPTGGNGA